MGNARVWVENRHPGALLVEASKKLARYPDKKRPGEWITHTVAEDVWGVFDLLSFPITLLEPQGFVDLIQVTTITDGKLFNVNARLAKVGTWIRDTFPGGMEPHWLGHVFVIGWVSRKHFRVWRWHWSQTDAHHWGGWTELDPQPVKRPRKAAPTPAEAPELPIGNPFD